MASPRADRALAGMCWLQLYAAATPGDPKEAGCVARSTLCAAHVVIEGELGSTRRKARISYEGVKTLEQPACDCPALSHLLLATLPR
eukprot:920334-Prymnesium_polylepis.1